MTAAVGSCTLNHQAFLYGSPDEFVRGMGPFAMAALERGDAVFAASKRPNVDALREHLGADAQSVQLEDTKEWMTRPFERLQAFKQAVADLSPGQSLSAMGEPVWDGSPAVVRQWARYESIINLALASAPMRFICLYDSSALPDRILDYAVETHPEQVTLDGRCLPCDTFVDPHRFTAGAAAAAPTEAIPLPLDGGEMRRALAAYARSEGVVGERLDELLLATSEVMANAFRHGGEPIEACAWANERELVCQVGDSGPGIGDPLAGWLPPTDMAIGGWGLPIARQLADAVEIASPEAGATVTLYFCRR